MAAVAVAVVVVVAQAEACSSYHRAPTPSGHSSRPPRRANRMAAWCHLSRPCPETETACWRQHVVVVVLPARVAPLCLSPRVGSQYFHFHRCLLLQLARPTDCRARASAWWALAVRPMQKTQRGVAAKLVAAPVLALVLLPRSASLVAPSTSMLMASSSDRA
jgi:hypothetical protein